MQTLGSPVRVQQGLAHPPRAPPLSPKEGALALTLPPGVWGRVWAFRSSVGRSVNRWPLGTCGQHWEGVRV